MKPYLQVTTDRTQEFNDTIARFKKDAVLVGIPEDENRREEGQPIGNAAILAINELGSSANNIPPRPVMATGIRNAQEKIAEQFKLAAQTVWRKGISALEIYYERAGIIASQSIKKVINDQEGINPPSEATLAARKAQGFMGTKALIVTGQLRNAITYVVRSIWGT